MNDYYNSITPAHLIGEPTISKAKPAYAKIAFFDSITKLNNAITSTFGRIDRINSLEDHIFWLKDVAENYKVKLMYENFKYCSFPAKIGNKKVHVTFYLEV